MSSTLSLPLALALLAAAPAPTEAGDKRPPYRELAAPAPTEAVPPAAPDARGAVTSFVVEGVHVDVFTPAGVIRGDVLVLPGWDSSRTDWCAGDHGLCDEAARRGLRLVMPEMGLSVYSHGFFPETQPRFRAHPDRTALERVIASLQKERALLADPGHTSILGRSTGGRGAVLLALDHPEWFAAVASLSGDFDQTKMPKDGLMEAVYGPFATFPARWRGVDNPAAHVDALKVPVYLGHGAKDRVVPPDQTHAFAASLMAHDAPVVLHVDDAGDHSHAYWRTELAPALDFLMSARDPAGLAYAKLRALAGSSWTATVDGRAAPAVIQGGAQGVALVHEVQQRGLLAVFSRDADAVAMSVWVDDGSSARLRSRADRPLELAFVDGLNLPPAAARPVGVKLAWRTVDEIVETWRWAGAEFDVVLDRR